MNATGPNAPSYGGSQVGAVLNYRLAPAARLDPRVYARSTLARGGDESDIAAGISARPIQGLPLRAHAEARVSRQGDRVELRPAAFVTAGIDQRMSGQVSLRGYAQAGYVGGDFSTAFADGSLVAERSLAGFEIGTQTGVLSAGAGIWGGAQKGAARLDIGPSLSLETNIGDTPARLSADYRLRVAGDAEPASGPALTLSASF